jgi:hypothetical protein
MNIALWILVGVAVVVGVVVFLIAPSGSEGATVVESVAVPTVSEVIPAPESMAPETEATLPQTELRSISYVVDGVIGETEYAHSTQVAGVTVYWINDSQALQIGLVAPVHGYIGFGIDPEFGMKGANIVIAAVEADGRVVARDDYGIGTMSHAADVDSGGMNDILSVAGSETADQTVVEFVIPLDSGDPFDKTLTAGETYGILVSYQATSDDFTIKHTGRGTGKMALDPAP